MSTIPASTRSLVTGGGTAALSSLALLVGYLISPPLLHGIHHAAHGGIDKVWWLSVGLSLLWVVVLHALVSRPLLLHVLLFPLYVTSTADLFLVQHFRSRLTSSYMSIAISDHTGTGEFVQTYGWALSAHVALLVVVYACGLRGIRALRFRVPPTVKWVSVSALILTYAALTVRQIRMQEIDLDSALLDVAGHDQSSPVGAICQVITVVHLLWQTDEHLAARREFSFGARKEAAEGEEIYVLVIGESSRPDHWSLNGYPRDTTPRLRQRANLLSLNDVITTAPYTARAVPTILSLADVADWDAVASQRSVISAFAEAGFETWWLSTQEVSQWGGIVYQLGLEAGRRRYFDRGYDMVLAEAVESILDGTDGPRKLLIVLHSKGSHTDYANRYPPDFRVHPDSGGSLRDDVVNAYDNSILYTDFVLSRILDALDRRRSPALLLYVSDHGQNLLDDDRGLLGHGVGTRYDLMTAAFVWWSDAMAARCPHKFAAARSNASLPASAACVSHSLLDIGGISAPQLDPCRSVFSDSFRPLPRLCWVHGRVVEYTDAVR